MSVHRRLSSDIGELVFPIMILRLAGWFRMAPISPISSFVTEVLSTSRNKTNYIRNLFTRTTDDGGGWRGGPQIAGIDLVAMLVSDSGLANTEPQWWNASPTGCFLIGLQPRGGWQILQRAVQWGDDRVAHAFGVHCSKPTLFAYFACSIRNRIEVWDTLNLSSPMAGEKKVTSWNAVGTTALKRPTKLIDGSRGGQAFICQLLRPSDDQHYGIEEQAEIQLLSVILVAAGFMCSQSYDKVEEVLRDDFEISSRLGLIFRPISRWMVLVQFILILALITVIYDLWKNNIYGVWAPYMIEICSIASWATGAIGLLMLGGNPRIKIAERELPKHIENRLQNLIDKSKTSEIKLEFGSLHGSVFTQDKGSCVLPADTIRAILKWKFTLIRTPRWYGALLWNCIFLLFSIVLQIARTRASTTGSTVMGIVILITTSVLRGSGISGPEEWMIPNWKRRVDSHYGAHLLGAFASR